ncbi:MAG TPA: glycoside hydrolase family 3 C-terminal domain-containing protein [Candidatus Limnocylindrales bacterium]|nr:glycoside hydrolase family 3 C-terminal domain-containing protein [Candidatus Limnocylindrales bacterium]
MHSTPLAKCFAVVVVLIAGFGLGASHLFAQNAPSPSSPPYLNPALPTEQRVNDLISRMTLEEKASQLVNQARAIPRLQIPAYDWWSESLHGVAVNGTTEFPEPIGLASTFDTPGIHEMAVAISIEARIKHVQAVRAGHSYIFEGLDFWAPNVNIFRDPRWGRGQETYGEDPFLTARMGVAFVTGMQGEDPHYYRTISTPKHYAVHSGPESTRHKADVKVSKHDEVDTYLPAFRATVTEGKAGSVMCAYNSINGQPACANEFLLVDQLRSKWGFNGYVVSDCEAVRNIFNGHHYKATQAEASAISLKLGMDNECIDFTAQVSDDHDYAPYIEAVKQGFLKESEIDLALKRLFTARIKLGMFDPPEMVPFTKTDEALLEGPAHRALARKLANESMVLLKNDGVLPLKSSEQKIAVVGPLGDQTAVLLGNYNGIPTRSVSVLEGMRTEFPKAEIQFVPGTQFLSKAASPVPAQLLTVDGKQGARAKYFSVKDALALFSGAGTAPLATRVEPNIGLNLASLPPELAQEKALIVGWETTLTPETSGEYYLGFRGSGFMRVSLDGQVITMSYGGLTTKLGHVKLEAGKAHAVKVDYSPAPGSNAPGELVWAKFDPRPSPEAIEATKKADVVVAVVGITSELEGEEMPVSEEGFMGGDRTSLDLPKPEQDLLESLAATGKPLVVVLMNGSALGVNWAKEHANAILEAWYSGEEGGEAVAQTLAGINNPAGRLPVTFYKSVADLPPFEDYSMANRTYRYFTGTPLYPFGYGLSYSNFTYSKVKLSSKKLKAGEPLGVDANVKNTGKQDGDEVVELYVTYPKLPGAPIRALCGFTRVHIAAGKTAHVHLTINPRDLSHVTEAGDRIIAPGAYKLSIGGGQPGTTAQVVETSLTITGQVQLPE